jgi:alcohol dehydrogenase
LFGKQAWSLLVHGLPTVLNSPHDLESRARMLLGAHLAGASIEASMLGATHALANPLSAHFGLTHGVAIGVMLPHVIRFNQHHVVHRYGDLADEAGLCATSDPHAGELLARHVTKLVERAGLPTRLADCDVKPEAVPLMAADAAQQWTGRFNPRPVDEASLAALYTGAF